MYRFSQEKKATREGFGKALLELGEKDSRIIALSAGVGDSTMVFPFREKFPKRYIEAGIAEQSMIGLAAGLSLAGKIPFATSFSAFLPGRCYDQIRQSLCYSNLNVKLAATHAGITVGADGATHQMMEDIAMLRATPNIRIIVPADSLEAEKATHAIAAVQGPCYLRLGREKIPLVTLPDSPFQIGKANVLREGRDAAIIACGIMVYYALLAAEELEREGISTMVVNMHTIKPIDKDAILKAAGTGAIVTAEEHQVHGGLGSAVAEVLVQTKPVSLKIIGMPDAFGESGKASELLEKYKLTDADITAAAKEMVKAKRR